MAAPYWRKAPVYLPRIYAPKTLRHSSEFPSYVRRGLVFFVPYFNQIKILPEKRLSRLAVLTAVNENNWQALDLMNSNLETTINAVMCHASKLEHCWLVASKSSKRQDGLLFFVPLLEAYLKAQGVKCNFHYDREKELSLTYHMDVDAEILTKVTDMLKGIGRQAQQFGLPPEQVIVYFNNAPRSTSLACFLTNLDQNRDLEFIGTHYDELGKPIGPNYPMIFHFEIEKKSQS
jgi:hypothetical protein